jgi:hypothetical protein
VSVRTRRSRQWLAVALTAAAAATFLVSWVISSVIRHGQRFHDVGAYSVLPSNRIDFYFLPLFAAAAVGLAWVSGTRIVTGRWALALAATFTAARLLFWANVATALELEPARAASQVAAAQASGPSLAVGALGMAAWVALGMFMWQALGSRAEAVGLHPSQRRRTTR